MHFEHTLKICPRFDEISKTIFLQVIITSSGDEKAELSQKILDVLYATEVLIVTMFTLYTIQCILYTHYSHHLTLLWNMISTSRKNRMIHTPTKPYNSHPTAFCVGLKVLYFRMVLQFPTSQKYLKSFKERPWVISTCIQMLFHTCIYIFICL